MQREMRNSVSLMKRREFCTRLAVAGVVLVAGSEHLARAAVSWNQLPVSPVVHADRRVTFLFQDAQAKSVVLGMGGIPPAPMKKKCPWHVESDRWPAGAGNLFLRLYR